MIAGRGRALIVAIAAATVGGACGSSGSNVAGGSTTSAAPATSEAALVTTTAAPTTSVTNAASTTTAAAAASSTTTTTTTADLVLLAAGDIGSCASSGDEATAALVNAHPSATVLTLGDTVYERGEPAEFSRCYAPSWGASKARTRPAVGNHDYATSGASGYFGYFGSSAGDSTKGYYSYDVGPWHVVALNSNCTIVSCAAGSDQERWLRADLAASRRPCTLAYWHHARFSSGTTHGSSTTVAPLWQALYDAGADLVLEGHEHLYERFGPLGPAGQSDPARGIRSFVVGTGGRSHYPVGTPILGSEARSSDTFGVLQLTLKPTRFDWQFLAEPGKPFRDAGSADCH